MARALHLLVLVAATLLLGVHHVSASTQLRGETRKLSATAFLASDSSTIDGSTRVQNQQLTPVPASSHEGEGVTSETTTESSGKSGVIGIIIAVVAVAFIVAGFLLFISKRRQQARDRISTIMDASETPYRSELT